MQDPLSFRLCTLFKLTPAHNLYHAIYIMTYKLPFRLSLCTETSRESGWVWLYWKFCNGSQDSLNCVDQSQSKKLAKQTDRQTYFRLLDEPWCLQHQGSWKCWGTPLPPAICHIQVDNGVQNFCRVLKLFICLFGGRYLETNLQTHAHADGGLNRGSLMHTIVMSWIILKVIFHFKEKIVFHLKQCSTFIFIQNKRPLQKN